MKKGTSLIINTKNEENNISACIDSAKDIVDEIIVVDMQSTDNTRMVSRKKKARVFKVKDYGYVEPARNYAIGKAQYEWILLLDADERLQRELKRSIDKIIKQNKHDVVYIPRKNVILGKWVKHTGWWPDYHPRLFKKGSVVWYNDIHKQPTVKGEVLKLSPKESNATLHYNYNSIDELIERTSRYSKYESGLTKRKPTKFSEILLYIDGEFVSRYFDKKGYLDGMHGFILSKFMETYRFFEIALAWEKSGYKDVYDNSEIYNTVKEYHSKKRDEVEISKMRDQIAELERALSEIKSAKFFRLWQKYCNLRDNLVRKVNITQKLHYYIKDGYIHNIQANSWFDDEATSESWQFEVYKYAERIIEKNNLKTVLDIGCGHGRKLDELIYPVCKNIVGIDLEHSIKYCNKNYEYGRWYVDDIENPKHKFKDKFDLVIAADVVEHLKNPNKLFDYISKRSHPDTYVIVSTPERDLVRGVSDMGPPQNTAHVREWNKGEFSRYVKSRDMKVEKHSIIYDLKEGRLKDGPKRAKKCQIVIAKFKGI